MAGRLGGKRAVVTGSTRGLGEAIAVMFGAEGAHVAVCGRSAEDGARVVGSIVEAGGRAEYIRLDLSDEQSVQQAIDRAAELFGGLDVLVNNAAPTGEISGAGGKYQEKLDGAIHELTTERWRAITMPSIDGLAWCIRSAVPHLLKSQAASIVNISSISSMLGMTTHSAYVTSKGAMNALTRAVAADYAPKIRCNALVSGAFMTPALAPAVAIPEIRDSFQKIILMGRIGDPKEMAYTATFFASDESSFITGVCIPVDGGQTIKYPTPFEEATAGTITAD